MLTEEKVRAHLHRVEVLHQWLCILGQTRCEDDELIDLVHLFEELGDKRTNKNIDGADLTVDLHWEHDVCVLDWLERGVHKCFVKIEDESLASSLVWSLWTQQILGAKVG